MKNDNLIKYEKYLIDLITSYCNEKHILISDLMTEYDFIHEEPRNLRIEWYSLICLSKSIKIITYQQWLSEQRKNKINNLLQ